MQTCFTGDTLVAAENGQKRIDEIEVGDKVWAFNVETRESELKTVTKVYVHAVNEVLHLYTDEGDIDTTANHPFYVIGKGWVAAGDLVVGDEVFNLDGTTSVVLGSATRFTTLTKLPLLYSASRLRFLTSLFLSITLRLRISILTSLVVCLFWCIIMLRQAVMYIQKI